MRAQGKTALIWAAEKGKADVAQLLIGEGKADGEAKDNNVSAPRVVRDRGEAAGGAAQCERVAHRPCLLPRSPTAADP